MNLRKSLACLALLTVSGAVSVTADAAVSSYAYVQVNGVECNPVSQLDADNLTFGWGGVRNPGGISEVTVICPVTRASVESYALEASLPIFKPSEEVYVYFSGTTSISCSFNKYTSTGSYYVKSMTLDTLTPAAKRMRASVGSDDLSGTLREYVRCDLTPGVTLRGLSSNQFLKQGDGGMANGTITPFPP